MSFQLDSFHEQAVSTPSHEDVTAMRELLVDTLVSAGHEPDIDDAGNVLAHRGSGEQLVLNTHLDTVPPHVPYERDGDIVRGRGACDAKGPLAAFLDAFLRADVTEGQLTLAVTTNEETTQTGGAHLGERLDASGYLVGEPTDLDVCTAARGQFEGEVVIRGESGHASDPTNGDNAIRAAAPILQALESYDDEYGPGAHDLLGRPTLTPSVIEGGAAINQIPGECTIQFDRRTVPPETVDGFFDGLRAHLAGWLPDAYDLDVGLVRPGMPAPEAFATDADAELVETLVGASGGERRPFGAATEASYFADDASVVIFGPGVLADEQGPVAHAEREFVRHSDVEAAARAVRKAVERLV
jgi:acetylornithine deacetylase/succinyl-diaminopimelate desuccinylase